MFCLILSVLLCISTPCNLQTMDKKSRGASKCANKSKIKTTVSDSSVKKTIVRNSQVPLKQNAAKTVNLQLGPIANDKDLSGDDQERFQSEKTENVKSFKSGSTSQIKNPKEKCGPSADKNKEEEIKRVNIPFGEKKYKDLVDLCSLEAVLSEVCSESSASTSARQRRACLINRDPEPVLSDYYTPTFDAEYIFTFPPVPATVTKEWSHNSRAVVDILDSIELDDSDS